MNSVTNRRALVRALNNQNWQCCYCGAKLTLSVLYDIDPEIWREQGVKRATLEHMVPSSIGGRRTKENSSAACGQCNNHRVDNPQCFDGKTLTYRGETVATLHGEFWVYTDGTKKRTKSRKLSERRRKIKNSRRR